MFEKGFVDHIRLILLWNFALLNVEPENIDIFCLTRYVLVTKLI